MRSHCTILVLALAGCTSFAGDNAPTTSQRPTSSTDTATVGEGTFELETGAAIDPGDSVDTPTVIKWGAGPATELFVGWSPYQEIALPGPDAAGVADLMVGTRHRFLEQGELRPSAAVQLATNLPTGDRSQGLSSGEIDFHVAGILTKTFGTVTGSAYWDVGVLGNPAGGTDLEHTLALAANTALGQRVGIFGEVTGVLGHENAVENYFATAGGSYAISRSLVFDVGATIGLNDEAPDFQLLFGVTANLGAPWSWF